MFANAADVISGDSRSILLNNPIVMVPDVVRREKGTEQPLESCVFECVPSMYKKGSPRTQKIMQAAEAQFSHANGKKSAG